MGKRKNQDDFWIIAGLTLLEKSIGWIRDDIANAAEENRRKPKNKIKLVKSSSSKQKRKRAKTR